MAKSPSEILNGLRKLFDDQKYVKQPINAYIIPTDDSHQNEYVGDSDARRAYVSGFKGSAGVAVVTSNKALLWTDGRYFTQANKELYDGWTLMKDGLPGTPSLEQWLTDKIPFPGRVAADPTVIPYRSWKKISSDLASAGHTLVPIEQNLVDLIWNDRPKQCSNPLKPLDIKYSDRKEMLRQMPRKDQGTAGEKGVDLDTLAGDAEFKRFPDLTTHKKLFNGVPFDNLPVCNIKASPNNTIVNITNYKGDLQLFRSCGLEGFKNTRKGTNIAAQATAISIGSKGIDMGIKAIRVRVRGIGPGRMSAIKGLQMAGLDVVSITDNTPVSWNPPRPRKAKKL